MKKTYAFKPLGVLTLIFDALMAICSIVVMTSLSAYSINELFYSASFLLAGVLGSIVCAILMYIYYAKREKALVILGNAIANTVVALLFALIIYNGDETGGLYKFVMVFAFILVIFNLIVLLRLDHVLMINILDVYLPAGKNGAYLADVTEKVNMNDTTALLQSEKKKVTVPTINGDSVKKFLKSKNGKMMLGVIIALVAIFAGYKVWDTFLNKTTLDVFEGMTLEFYGYNGEGYASIFTYPDIDYDLTDSSMQTFVNSMSYDIENNGQLSNGDKVKVSVVYSNETAKELKVTFKTESQDFEVTGLTIKYQSASEIDSDLCKQAYNVALNKATSQATFYKAYYACQVDEAMSSQSNYLIFVFQIPYQTYDWDLGEYVTKNRYICYYTDFDSSFDANDSYFYTKNLYMIDSWDYVTDESQVFDSIEDSFYSYSSTTVTYEEVTIDN